MTATGLPGPEQLAQLAAGIASEVRDALVRHRQERGGGERLHGAGDLKATHEVDEVATAAARAAFADWHCNLVIEGETPTIDPQAAFCVYLDPVDGSLNWDRGVGDPAFVLSAARGPRAESLDDLAFSYVAGLRSGDRYQAFGGVGRHRCGLTGRESRLQTAAPTRLADAIGYLRAGYGGARRQLLHTLPLYLAARDLRAHDNAAIEFGDIARNAAHFMVEARSLSDGFNLLAWPLLRAAGGVLLDLDGGDLSRQPFVPQATVDYVAAGNRALAEALLDCMHRFEQQDRAELDALLRRLD